MVPAASALTCRWVIVQAWTLLYTNTVDHIEGFHANQASTVSVVILAIVSHTHRLISQPVVKVVVTVTRAVKELR